MTSYEKMTNKIDLTIMFQSRIDCNECLRDFITIMSHIAIQFFVSWIVI